MGIPNEIKKYNQDCLPFEMGHLIDRFIKKAEDELKETTDTREQGLEQLRELVLSESDLCGCRMGDEFLLMFLRARKFNTLRAFNLFKRFQVFKRKHKALFADVNEESLSKIIANKAFGFVPYRDKDGCVVLVVRVGGWNPSDVGVDDLIRIVILFLFLSIEDPVTQVCGYKVFFDFKDTSLKHIRYCTPYYLFLLYHGTQECFPGRFKAIHVLNPSFVFQAGWSVIKPFLSEKLKKRIIIHAHSVRVLRNYYPEAMIPVEFEGELKDFDNSQWIKKAVTKNFLQILAM